MSKKKECAFKKALDEWAERRRKFIEEHGHDYQYVFAGPPELNTNYTGDPCHPGDASQWYSSVEMMK